MYSRILILFLSLCLFSCKGDDRNNVVRKIILHRGDKELRIDINYDDDGRISKLGGSTINYSGDKISVNGAMLNWGDYNFTSIEYKLLDGRAVESNSLCAIKRINGTQKFLKNVQYKYTADSIIAFLDYKLASKNTSVEKDTLSFCFNDKNQMTGKFVNFTSENKVLHLSDSFIYDNGINFQLNLDMLPFVTYLDGTDLVLYFLLDLDGRTHSNDMPSGVSYNKNGNRDSPIFIHYIMNGDSPTRVEMVTDSMKLISRIDLEFYNLKN